MRNLAAQPLTPPPPPPRDPEEGVDGGAVDSEQYRLECCRQDSLGPLVGSQGESNAGGGLGAGARPRILVLGKGLI